jgi:hypothetical protein
MGSMAGRERKTDVLYHGGCILRSHCLAVAICLASTIGVGGAVRAARATPGNVAISPLDRAVPAAESVHVRVSRREMRVLFPPETAQSWGWTGQRAPDFTPGYSWVVLVNGVAGPGTLSLSIRREVALPRDFTSLEHLVSAAQLTLCTHEQACTRVGVRASVEQGRVVLSLTDSVAIARLFGMRPAHVAAWRPGPGDNWRFPRDSVRVEYVAPRIPLPGVTMRADAERARRRRDPRDFRVNRYIRADRAGHPFVWLLVGESVPLALDEEECELDLCLRRHVVLEDSGWEVRDPRVARLLRPSPSYPAPSDFMFGAPRFYLKALRPGRTVVRARGVTGVLDAAVRWLGAIGVIEREILVTRPIARLKIVSAPDTVRVHEGFLVGARATDETGRTVEGVPIEFRPEPSGEHSQFSYDTNAPIRLVTRGPTRIVASLRQYADTVTVIVVDSADYRRPR